MTTLLPSFLDGSNSFLQPRMTTKKSLDEFEFRQDSITDYRVSYPWTSEKSINNVLTFLAPLFFIGSSSFLKVTSKTIKSQMHLKFGQIRPWTAELTALERLQKSLLTYNWRSVLTTLVPSFLDGSSSFSQVKRTTIKALTSLNFSQILSPNLELAAIERLIYWCVMLLPL